MHPGQHVRDAILKPKGLTVTAAAKLVGVGRSALSRILNGRVPITPDMAARLERTFGVPARELLELQAKFDAAHTIAKDSPTKAFSYVPPFLSIKATDIEEWVSRNISARTRLSVLLRTLINSTSTKLTQVDFPGNDDAERHGWDGTVDAAEGNPWIPSGRSGWEFGTNQDIKTKATQDLAKAVKATNEKEREETTFVFVTPRHWPGKKDWITEQKAKKQWKDVRAYDSSELEQWLEQSLAGQTWFSNETQRPSHGVRTLDQWWTDWADVADPTLSGAFFRPAVDHAKRMFVSWLSKEAEKPIVIAADSTEEGLAFLSQLFREKELVPFRDRVLVFDERGQLPKLARGKKDFVAVTTNREVERELGPFCKTLRSILIYPRNAANADPHIILEPLNYKTFQSGLKEMGCLRDDIAKYRDESGYSLTVLRRRLSHIPEIRTPQWAADHATAASLIPFLFTGAWHSSNEADQTALSLFANDTSHEILEKDCQRLAMLNDAPLWSVGTYRGVVSKIDLLFAIAKAITVDDLKRYFSLAELILGEDDPKLDLPDDERWTAALYGKSREFSSELRKGISETLVLLAVHGNHLFKTRLGFDSEAEASHLVRRLLTPLKTRLLEANDRDLSAYAEAAPKEFLSILEEDLNTSRPESYDLMRPVGNSIGAGCPRAGLLWALEGLAWHPNTLPRVALILAQFAGIKIDDNWGNKPIRSLMSIFRAWMPQTAANHNTRLE
ncbi:MAG: HigA family addiction module antidote protein, partial [Deltaproteobacteria bacterium]|nr:HigA family addiction module antidote protein [Deltaproteobacteria bacterium]